MRNTTILKPLQNVKTSTPPSWVSRPNLNQTTSARELLTTLCGTVFAKWIPPPNGNFRPARIQCSGIGWQENHPLGITDLWWMCHQCTDGGHLLGLTKRLLSVKKVRVISLNLNFSFRSWNLKYLLTPYVPVLSKFHMKNLTFYQFWSPRIVLKPSDSSEALG